MNAETAVAIPTPYPFCDESCFQGWDLETQESRVAFEEGLMMTGLRLGEREGEPVVERDVEAE
jgi:hypothetical protein